MTLESEYAILDIDPLLRQFRGDIGLRMDNWRRMRARLLKGGSGGLSSCANGHMHFGFHRTEGGWAYREWAPNAKEIWLFGDFNGWNRMSHPLRPVGDGAWELEERGDAPHGSKVRIMVRTDGETFERVPLYCRRMVQNPSDNSFDGQIWLPPQPFRWTDGDFAPGGPDPLLIYETHVGMSGEKAGISSYADFTESLLPRVKRLGYNAIQLMAVMEHPYYGSFGYQVSGFFAASSRFGEPEDLKALVDAAHGAGISVLLDLVHSHAAGNEVEGIGRFDGTVHQFFHVGAKGDHPQWGSKIFDYGKPEVLHFLLSNLKFWLEEYHFDGFRFDGVTSMLYADHGLGGVFDSYGKYFSMNTDTDAVAYLQLATELCREVRPGCVLISEDMSGMPGMCIPVKDGGIGFDYRLSMGVPDIWTRYLERRRDEDWDIGSLWHELTQRRPREKVVGYCESHDQALVGDKTIMFRLADKEMYWHMDKGSQTPPIDRAMALHKMIRLITCTCAGEAYLNFMGNEFGHPEWIDFPREGNGNSYHYARRQWSLADSGLLRYHYLQDFDMAMIRLVKENRLLGIPSELLLHHEGDKLLAYRKGRFAFFFNFHPVRDCEAELDAPGDGEWRMALHSSWPEFGGYRPRDCVFARREGGRIRVSVDRRSAIVFETDVESFVRRYRALEKTDAKEAKGAYYITTPIYYPSSNLHIGHTYCTVMADAVARFKRMTGYDVMFLTGTDEHGQKIQKIAAENGLSPQQHVDGIVSGIKELWKTMEISYDDFIRTTEDRHRRRVQEIFRRINDAGDIYRGEYEGWYCTPCEAFWTETQLDGGRCPDCGREAELTREPAYFFRLSKYQDRIIELFEKNPEFLQPDARRNEMLQFVRQGLEDLCISRSSFDWGIPVPIEEGQVIYVWLDALSNYITALGWPDEPGKYDRYWPADVHLVGKEIVRFHTVIWPAMLMSMGLPLPKKVMSHGWLLLEGGKMSKSRGNVVDPVKLIERYGVDALKYFLLREYSFGHDGLYTNEVMLNRINSDLANDLGNLLSRTVSMIEKYRGGEISAPDGGLGDSSLAEIASSAAGKVEAHMDRFAFSHAMEEIWGVVSRTNKYIDENSPWVLARDEAESGRLDAVLYSLAEALRIISILILPFMHTTAEEIRRQLGISGEPARWEDASAFGLLGHTRVCKGPPLFPRIDIAKELDELESCCSPT